jgi:hypothetical protein
VQSQGCDKTFEVRRAITSGSWTQPVLEHALNCEACSEVSVAAWLAEKARAEACCSIPANADLIWWKARLKANGRNSAGVLVPIAAAQLLALVGAILAVFVVASPVAADQSLKSFPLNSMLAVAVVLSALLLSLGTQRIFQYYRQHRVR